MPESSVYPETSDVGEAKRPAPGGGLTMLDAAAMVTGGAVASVHFREFADEIGGLTLLGWALLVPAFTWLALTAAGPFVFLVRRFSRRPEGYPGPDDWLWLAFGLPWIVAALVRSASGDLPESANHAYATALFLGLAAASVPALARLWRLLPRIDPMATGPSSATGPPPGSDIGWTGRIGRVVAVAWPLQFGLGLVVTK